MVHSDAETAEAGGAVTPALLALIERDIAAYKTDEQKAAYRAGLSSAVAICDQIKGRFERETRKTKQWSAIGALEICGALIWAIRGTIRLGDRTSASTDARSE
jgi:hypothetical protein